MAMSAVLERFFQSAPVCAMHRALLEQVFAPAELDAVFERAARVQYQRELLFSTLVELTSQVVCRISKSVHAAYQRQREKVSVSIRALYGKLNHVETDTSRALVQHTAQRVMDLIERTQGKRAPLLPGYRTRILDGNHLGKSEHRLGVLRGTAAGALPGHALVLLDPEYMVITDVIPCEDAHAQERSLLDQVLPRVAPRDVLIEDRNFCTRAFLWGIQRKEAFFVIRQHARMRCESALSAPHARGESSTGEVYEQTIEIRDPSSGETTNVRRVTLKLTQPTRGGDREVHLLSNLPQDVSAIQVAELYRQRWTLEQAFNELTTHLRCELNTLGYPKAALFAFCVAVCSYNLLAAVQGALRGAHGEQKMEQVSNYFLTDEINTVYAGMMVATPPEEWQRFATMTPHAFAAQLRRWAATVDLTRYPKQRRGPKKPKPKPPNAQFQHVSTARLLAARTERQPPNKTKKTPTKPKKR